MATSTISVQGLRELHLAFSAIDKTLDLALKTALKAAAEPVKTDAAQLARRRIKVPREGIDWSQMRVGATGALTLVYVAPVARSRLSRQNPRLRRLKFAEYLLGQAMEPALERNEARVAAAVGDVLDRIGRQWGSI